MEVAMMRFLSLGVMTQRVILRLALWVGMVFLVSSSAAAMPLSKQVVLKVLPVADNPPDMEVVRDARNTLIFKFKLESIGGKAKVSAITFTRKGTPLAFHDFWQVSLWDEGHRRKLASGDFEIDGQYQESLTLRLQPALSVSPDNPRVLALRANFSYNATPDDTHRLVVHRIKTKAKVNGLGLESSQIRIRDFACCGVGEPMNTLWVSEQGDDANEGSINRPLRTIGEAARRATEGTAIYVMPGVYREEWIVFNNDGTPEHPILLTQAPNTNGRVVIRGSVHASTLNWTEVAPEECRNLFPNACDYQVGWIYSAPLQVNPDRAPRFIVQLDGEGNLVRRFYMAREPDLAEPEKPWKYTQMWWTASGSGDTYSSQFLTDTEDDICEPEDSECRPTEPGNLTSDFLGNLKGARIYIDGRDSYLHEAIVKHHDRATGTVELYRPLWGEGCDGLPSDYCYNNPIDETYPPFGRWSKYYVENKSQLLDREGEWWYDWEAKRLYFFAPNGVNPATLNVEISVRDLAFLFEGKSHIVLDNLTIEYYNGTIIKVSNYSIPRQQTRNLTFHNLTIRGGFYGISVEGSYGGEWNNCTIPPDVPRDKEYNIDGIRIEGSELAWMDHSGLDFLAFDHPCYPQVFYYPLIKNVTIRKNTIHDVHMYNSAPYGSGTFGIHIWPVPDHLIIEGNYTRDTGGPGIELAQSVQWNGEIKMGDALIMDNVIETACLHQADCGALRFYGDDPAKQSSFMFFKNVLIYRNEIRNTFGWDYYGHKTRMTYRACGTYFDNATNFYLFRNIFFNNAVGVCPFHGYQMGTLILSNNVIANNGKGTDATMYWLGNDWSSSMCTADRETLFENNIFVANNALGEQKSAAQVIHSLRESADRPYGEFQILDYNLYHANRTYLKRSNFTRTDNSGKSCKWQLDEETEYSDLAGVQEGTDWEDHGVAAPPSFRNYPGEYEQHAGLIDYTDPNLVISDFHLTDGSPAIDQGTSLHNSLQTLLNHFRIKDKPLGNGYDLGAYEWYP